MALVAFGLVTIAFLFGAEGFPAILTEDFDDIPADEDQDWCWKSSNCDYLDVKDTTFASDKVLEITYEPNYQGSPRIQQKQEISPGLMRAAVSYNLYFDEAFEWVKGGKLGIGFFGGTATTGCKSIDPAGFSLRTMWRREGQLVMYMYDQDRTESCGQDIDSEIYFETGRWYHMTLYIELNSPADESNGKAILYVDGEQVARLDGVRWRGSGKDNVLIDNWGLSTFYGGSATDWSPSTDTYLFIDNVSLAGSTEKSSCASWCDGVADLSAHCNYPMHPCSGCEACGGTAAPAPSTTGSASASTTVKAPSPSPSPSPSPTASQEVTESCTSSCVANGEDQTWLVVCGWSSCNTCEICDTMVKDGCKLTCYNNMLSKGEATVCAWSSCEACDYCQ
mmetsp:Transcript_57129/g.121431  ORF Transcript_57129/g.121431 Transcript_57129/m.121431 type:complete len:393 (-) Transcript_57129:523-1701(-)